MRFQLNRKDIFFYIGFIAYLIPLVLECTVLKLDPTFMSACKYFRYIAYLAFVLKIVLDRYYDRQIFWTVVSLALIALSVLQSNHMAFIYQFLLLLSAKDIVLSKIVKVALCVQSCMILVIVTLSQMGIVQDYIADAVTRARHALGFEWANTVPFLFFFITLGYVYLREKHVRWYELAILEAITIVLYWVTDTKMSLALGTVFLIVVYLYGWWNNRKVHNDKVQRRLKNLFLMVIPSVFCLIALGMQIFYDSDNELWARLNKLLTQRLKYGQAAFEEYGVTPFGTHIHWIGFGLSSSAGDYNYVDSSYMKLMLNYGVVFLIIVIVAYTFCMYKAIKANDVYLQIVLFFILAFSITEPRLIDLAYHPYILYVVAAVDTKRRRVLREYGEARLPRVKLRGTNRHIIW